MSENANLKVDLEKILSATREVLCSMGAGWDREQGLLQRLMERLGEARLHLAVLGQFKRGKSTLLNALLGENLLPSAVVPLTAIPTLIEYGETRCVQLVFHDGSHQSTSFEDADSMRAFLIEKVTEEGNPSNRLGLDSVKIQCPSPILSEGVVLIDTPGIGSIYEHNMLTTVNFLSRCDAAVFLVSADPPITQTEVDFLKKVGSIVPTLFFALNKTDYLLPDELGMALSFLKRVLVNYGFSGDERVFCLSARRGLLARQTGDSAAWIESGMGEFYDYLVDFLATEKSRALYRAISKRAENLTADILMRLDLVRKSLAMPVEELESRLGILEAKLVEAEQQRQMTRDIVQGEHRRTSEMVEELAAGLNRRTAEEVARIVEESIDANLESEDVENLVRHRLNDSIPVIFNDALRNVYDSVRDRVAGVLEAQRERALSILDGVRKVTAEVFNINYTPPQSMEVFGIKEAPFWVTNNAQLTLSPLPSGWTDRLLSKRARITRIRKRLGEEVETIVARNVENLRFAMLQSIDAAFNRFLLDFDEQLDETLRVIRDAIKEMRSSKVKADREVSREIAKLDSVTAALQKTLGELGNLKLQSGRYTLNSVANDRVER